MERRRALDDTGIRKTPAEAGELAVYPNKGGCYCGFAGGGVGGLMVLLGVSVRSPIIGDRTETPNRTINPPTPPPAKPQ